MDKPSGQRPAPRVPAATDSGVPASVEDYLAALPHVERAVLEQLRETIKAVAPDATEAIAYGMPAFRVRGRFLVSCAAFRNHYSLFPASGAVRAAIGHELEPYVAGKATLRFKVGEPLPVALVERIVRVRLGELKG